MNSWCQGVITVVTSRMPTVLSLLFLAAIGVWGAGSGWQAPSFSSLLHDGKGKTRPDAPETTSVEEDLGPLFIGGPGWAAAFPHGHKRIVFPSLYSVIKAGLQWATAEEHILTEFVFANGMIDYDPTTYAHLATRAPGTIWRVEKQIGQSVHIGEVLALVEAAEVGKVKSDFLASLTQYELRVKVLQRMQEARAAVSERTFREAEASVKEASIRLFSDQQALLNLGLVVRFEDLLTKPDDQRVRELRLLGLPYELRTSPSADTLTANLLPVVAPFDGQIVQRNAAIGEAVTAIKPLFVVADLRQVHLEMAVEPRDVSKLRVGQSVIFTPEGENGIVATGKLAHIGPEVDEKTRKVWVHAEAENPDGRLRPHSFGNGRIVVREEPRAVTIPMDAIQKDGSHNLVFVRSSEGKEFQIRHVLLGLRSGTLVEVVGVQPGEEVVTTGSHALISEILKDRLAEAD